MIRLKKLNYFFVSLVYISNNKFLNNNIILLIEAIYFLPIGGADIILD